MDLRSFSSTDVALVQESELRKTSKTKFSKQHQHRARGGLIREATSPNVFFVSPDFSLRSSRKVVYELSSDHMSIIIGIQLDSPLQAKPVIISLTTGRQSRWPTLNRSIPDTSIPMTSPQQTILLTNSTELFLLRANPN